MHINFESSDYITLDAELRENYTAKAAVLMLHGINSDKDEEGLFVRLSSDLPNEEYNIFRFDFRCHGNSDNNNQMTIQGETEDFLNALSFIIQRWNIPVYVVAASFGAVSLLNSVNYELFRYIKGVVLLNPVLDLQHTFFQSPFEWPKQSFNEDSYKKMEMQGYFLLDNGVHINVDLFNELVEKKPFLNLCQINVPVLLIHGDADTYVSYEKSLFYSKFIQKCDFVTVKNANHGFGNRIHEDYVRSTICSWIKEN